MAPVKERDETKLPRWAQMELRRLRDDLADAQHRLTVGPESLVRADPYSDAPRPLGDDTTVEFTLPGGKIRVRMEGDALDVHGGDSLAIWPRSSNGVRIRAERF